MANYNYSKEVNAIKLQKEINNSSFASKVKGIITNGPSLTVITTEDLLSNEQGELQILVDLHTTTDYSQTAYTAVQSAVNFGKELMIEFASENVLMGITQAGKTKEVLDFFAPVKNAIDTGSLYTALDEIDTLIAAGLPPSLEPFVTLDRLNKFKGKIQAYLGI